MGINDNLHRTSVVVNEDTCPGEELNAHAKMDCVPKGIFRTGPLSPAGGSADRVVDIDHHRQLIVGQGGGELGARSALENADLIQAAAMTVLPTT
jgi:hypothetical protein